MNNQHNYNFLAFPFNIADPANAPQRNNALFLAQVIGLNLQGQLQTTMAYIPALMTIRNLGDTMQGELDDAMETYNRAHMRISYALTLNVGHMSDLRGYLHVANDLRFTGVGLENYDPNAITRARIDAAKQDLQFMGELKKQTTLPKISMPYKTGPEFMAFEMELRRVLGMSVGAFDKPIIWALSVSADTVPEGRKKTLDSNMIYDLLAVAILANPEASSIVAFYQAERNGLGLLKYILEQNNNAAGLATSLALLRKETEKIYDGKSRTFRHGKFTQNWRLLYFFLEKDGKNKVSFEIKKDDFCKRIQVDGSYKQFYADLALARRQAVNFEGFLGEFSALAVRHNIESDVSENHEYRRTVAETDTQRERGDPKKQRYLYPEDIKEILEGSSKVKHLIQEDGRVDTQSLDWDEIKQDEELCKAIKLNNAHIRRKTQAHKRRGGGGGGRDRFETTAKRYIREMIAELSKGDKANGAEGASEEKGDEKNNQSGLFGRK
mmetsp:Transcript_31107/g.74181  ORF Transcript_31107/g.74181 Transcript_31107/m.74181 type:complete len:495 (-) Transcript_31107:78-1562(-)